ncbi:MAG TPA: gluconate 2-dehydrogenase subunit 3 family protein [Solirubrobacterales bacterium]|nr:gluconate 2-dehydrogenase subunit 3 family protein [Solirubrobacterales bacterium]
MPTLDPPDDLRSGQKASEPLGDSGPDLSIGSGADRSAVVENSVATNNRDGVSRRAFMKRAGVVAGGVALLGSLPAAMSQAAAGAKGVGAPGALTAPEMATLEGLLAQLLPKDSLGPGAVEAGVPDYIDRALAGSYKMLLPAYKSFLSTIEKAAEATGGSSFAVMPQDAQIKLIEAVESGKTPGVTAAAKTEAEGFLQLVLEHMREGMFGDPMYGGNRDLAGWSLLGYPGIQLAVTEQLQEVDAKVPPTQMTAKNYGGEPYNGTPV